MPVSQEEINKRIAKSREKYKAVKAKQEKQKQLRKAERAKAVEKRQQQREQIQQGLDWEHFGKIHFAETGVGKFSITCGYKIISEGPEKTIVHGAYAIKAPSDKKNEKIGQGLVAYRLMTAGANSTMAEAFEVLTPLIRMQKHIPIELISSMITAKIYAGEQGIPERVRRELLGPIFKAYKKQVANLAKAVGPILKAHKNQPDQ